MFNLPDSEILPLTMEHNFWTWSAQAKVNPIPVTHARGIYFWDAEGKRYMDFNSMTMCSNIGHGNERVIEAIAGQARELTYAGPGMATKPRAILGKLLSEITPPGLDRFLYTLGGADANENAIKLARAFTGRHKILARYRSYHGATSGAMALTGDPRRWMWEPNLMPGVVHFLDPYRYRSTFHRANPDISEQQFTQDYLNHLDEIIQLEGPDTIAAVLLETVTGTNGIIIPPQGYLQGVRALCDRYGVLLITDEVMSGFGRTGRWFAIDHWGVTPDIITMAKGITSAYLPLSATAVRKEIYEAFKGSEEYDYFRHVNTFGGNPAACALALKNLEIMENEQLFDRSRELGEYLKQSLASQLADHPFVGDVRGKGLLVGIELVKDKESKEPLEVNLVNKVIGGCKGKGLIIGKNGATVAGYNNVLTLSPPLNIETEDLEFIIQTLTDELKAIQ